MPPNDTWLNKEMALQPLLFSRVLPVKNCEIFRKVLVTLLLLFRQTIVLLLIYRQPVIWPLVFVFSKYYNDIQHFL